VADEEGKFGIGEEGALGDRVGGEEGGGASEGAGGGRGEGGGVGEGDAAGGGGERRSWKAVRRWPSERSWFGLMRRMVAMAVAAVVCAASVKVGSFGAEGWGVAVRDGGVRRRWWLKLVWGRRQRVMMRAAPWVWTPGMEVK